MSQSRFDAAITAIDAANADDPNTIVARGRERPKEQAHAEMVSEWVERLVTEPSEALRLAARAHHVRRWEIPRSSYPSGRAGYLRWRRRLHDHHAETVRGILRGCGYDDALVARVCDLVTKRAARSGDPEAQALEDALCLVFVETQFDEVAARLDDEKMVDVVAKTLRKMSPEGRREALGIDLDPSNRAIVTRAVDRLEES